ncbi:GNAT family N-acetyltransferase [Acidaminobacter hydrogenoformans]|uniref:N-acetylglutamate synthase, GNAT family n=1 Tax=Acidaminobacter hydrogenoformans DSM 2784 TaxID=1120920 RepID=A0A1G5RXH7_9FIRM|nr:GNAT family N-acetyltransferase [Acidaminobacter hydrogenoformans]SCZ78161.1 N-acetylglutamate synthase, GNAT family [Acidaminobacter hydrogenoformans DSM 2784]
MRHGAAKESVSFTIRHFQKSDLDWVIDRHDKLYAEEQGFDHTFRPYVEGPVYDFGATLKPEKENLWVAEAWKGPGSEGIRAGMIAIVRVDDETAQLRWYLVEPEYRGVGLGRTLMKTALDFTATAGYKKVFLWTVSQLDAARHLYIDYGFTLTQTETHEIWGKTQTEERWELEL